MSEVGDIALMHTNDDELLTSPSRLDGEGGGTRAHTAISHVRTPHIPGPSPQAGGERLRISGADCIADVSGALYWPCERLLVVSDLHLEKGSGFAARGSLLPPYDTGDTLARLSRLITRYSPRAVVALGDNFHDGRGAQRMAPHDRATLASLQRGRDWIWITGNHDPEPLDGIGGEFMPILMRGPLTFRHIASPDGPDGEVSGHLHPVAVVVARGRGLRRRCYVSDGHRMVMPAFGAYAGGLNIRHRAFGRVFGTRPVTAHVMGDSRVFAIAAMGCVGG